MYFKNRFRVAVFGDNKWCLNLLKKISKDRSIEIIFICGRYKKDSNLSQLAKSLKIKFIKPKNINSDQMIKFVKESNLNLCVSMSYDQIFKKKFIKTLSNKIYNCHAGLLPSYRGRNVLNWALINGEKFYGVTFHKVNHYIDRGDILLQKKLKIFNSWEYKEILDSAYKHCANICFNGIKILQKGRYTLQKQKESKIKPSYFKKRKKGDEILSLNLFSNEIINFVRALSNPGPVARIKYKNGYIFLNKISRLLKNIDKNYKTGEIIAVRNNAFVFATADKKKIDVLRWKSNKKLRLKVGDILG
jgi:methionyl-tRNA formyltransferase|tara:strand:+ start:156 stop:1064 length:909 start_codon:yes stop_codon:yes gene_type:complete